jgi:O-acetyl-ADP-ribose deacetylase (regulator of RNase III)
LRAGHYGGGLAVGEAVATTAGLLPARWVIHTVGPVYSPTSDRSELLANCHRNVLRVAAELGATSVAFPAISTGVYRWPLPDAARIALTTVSTTPASVSAITFVLFDREAFDTFQACLDALGPF